MTPPPVASPQPPANTDDGSSSDVRYPTEREARLIAEAQLAAHLEKVRKAEDAERAEREKKAAEEEREEKRATRIGRALQAGSVVTAIAIAFGVFFKLEARGEERIAPVEKRLDRVEVTVQQQAVETVRNTTMLEMLVKAQGMTPPPPAPKVTLPDGGVP